MPYHPHPHIIICTSFILSVDYKVFILLQCHKDHLCRKVNDLLLLLLEVVLGREGLCQRVPRIKSFHNVDLHVLHGSVASDLAPQGQLSAGGCDHVLFLDSADPHPVRKHASKPSRPWKGLYFSRWSSAVKSTPAFCLTPATLEQPQVTAGFPCSLPLRLLCL